MAFVMLGATPKYSCHSRATSTNRVRKSVALLMHEFLSLQHDFSRAFRSNSFHVFFHLAARREYDAVLHEHPLNDRAYVKERMKRHRFSARYVVRLVALHASHTRSPCMLRTHHSVL